MFLLVPLHFNVFVVFVYFFIFTQKSFYIYEANCRRFRKFSNFLTDGSIFSLQQLLALYMLTCCTEPVHNFMSELHDCLASLNCFHSFWKSVNIRQSYGQE